MIDSKVREYQICSRCILDTNDDPDIHFNENGICNHCLQYEARVKKELFVGEEGKKKMDEIFSRMKESGKGKKYDCLLGVSGGVDSTYLAYIAKEHGLRPLLVHFDNGWNSEIAVKNIENIVTKLGFDLHTHVVNWDEFRDIQLSFLKSSVIDIELPTDHGFLAVLYEVAKMKGIRYILSGHNLVTEGILPKCMRWNKMDSLNLRAIHRKYGSKPIKTFPYLSFYRFNYILRILKLVQVSPLNYLNYQKEEAKQIIKDKLGWRDYGGKHYENIFTRFYQGYILPTKFHVDKRKAHLSTLINSKQITREQALEEIKAPIYDPAQLKIDMEFVLKKFGLTQEEFQKMMAQPPRPHDDFPTYVKRHYVWNEKFFTAIQPFTRMARKILGKPKPK